MKLEYKQLLPADFDPQSRVWIYQASRLFTLSEALEIEDLLQAFADSWTSHGDKVKGSAQLFFGQFIVLMADETASGVSGCSTDSSVRLIKTIEEKTGANLFDRQNMAFVVKDKIQLLPLSQMQYSIENGFVNGGTLYFNNLVATKSELENNWIVPVKDSWLGKKYSFGKTVSS